MAKRKSSKRKSSLADGGSKKGLFTKLIDNLQSSFTTKGVAKEALHAVLGATVYVLVPTAFEAVTRIDITGWKMWVMGTASGLLVGGAMKSGGVITGTVGASVAHFHYAKGNGAYIKPIFGQYASRFDPQAIASAFADANTTPALQSGAELRRLPDGSTVALYPDALMDNYANALKDNYTEALKDNYTESLNDNHSNSVVSEVGNPYEGVL